MGDRLVRSVVFGLAALALAWASDAAANIFAENGADPRLIASPVGEPDFAPVGMVQTLSPVPYRDGRSVSTTGTGFAVSPCLFLTNYHGVFGGADSVAFPPATVRVAVWTRGGTLATSDAMPIAWGDPATNGKDDWALLQLSECLGGRPDVGWFALEFEPQQELFARTLNTAGYADDLKSRFVQQGCHIHAVSLDDKALNDCANRGGTSGSPLFYMKDGVAVAVALQRGELNRTDPVLPIYSHDYANTAVLMGRVLARDDVRRTIQADFDAHLLANPLRGSQSPVEAVTTAPLE